MIDIRNLKRAALAAAGLLALAGTTTPAAAGTTERVNVSSTGKQANAESLNPAISAGGRLVAFASLGSNLVPDDTNGTPECNPSCGFDVFVRDRLNGTTERVSVSPRGRQGNSDSGRYGVAISAGGRFVAFS